MSSRYIYIYVCMNRYIYIWWWHLYVYITYIIYLIIYVDMILCSRCRTGLLTHWPVLCNLKHHVKYTIKAVWSLRNRTSWEHSRPTMPKVKVNKGPHPNYQWKREHHWWQRFVLETKNLDLMFGSSKNLHSWKKWSGKINQSRNSWNGSSIGLVRYTIHVYKHVYTINKSMYIYIYTPTRYVCILYISLLYLAWHVPPSLFWNQAWNSRLQWLVSPVSSLQHSSWKAGGESFLAISDSTWFA